MDFYDSLPDTPAPTHPTVLRGHDAIVSRLAESHASGRMGQATIFSGPRGIGKATAAFALIRAILEKHEGQGADGSVSAQIEAGAHPSVIHLTRSRDARDKSFRTGILIDDMRRITGQFTMTSGRSGPRFVVIDPLDDLNRSSSNALLKSLEEPPADTHFILIAHDLGSALPTIRSRCRVERFSPLTIDDVAAVLKTVGLDDPEADALARYAGGSPRHAIMLARFGGLDILSSLNGIFGSASDDPRPVRQLATSLTEKDRDVHYALAMGFLEDGVVRAARDLAGAGHIAEAARLIALQQDIKAVERQVDAYNTDRRSFLVSTIRQLRSATRNLGTALDFTQPLQ